MTLTNRLTVLEMAGREDKRRFLDHVNHVKEALGYIEIHQINGQTGRTGDSELRIRKKEQDKEKSAPMTPANPSGGQPPACALAAHHLRRDGNRVCHLHDFLRCHSWLQSAAGCP